MSRRRQAQVTNSATHADVPSRPRRRLLAGLAALTVAGATAAVGLVSAAPAQAAPITAKVQLSLSGLADSKNPVGGSVIGIRPGDSVSLTTATVPTRGLDKLGLGDLVGGVLDAVAPVRSVADFGKLPNGKANTTVKTSPAVTFTFPKAGTYNFTWSMKRVTLLGLVPIDLDGNQLAQAGVKLNADNQYVGKIVVSNNPPKGGLSIQLPKVQVAPSAPVVGQLPTITVPGVQAPTISVPSLGTLVPNLPTGGKTTSAPSKPSSKPSSAAASSGPGYQLPGESIPEQVVPGSSGNVATLDSGNDYTSGGFSGILPTRGDSLGAKQSSGGATVAGQPEAGSSAAGTKTVELAADSGNPSSQLPVILAILAIIALALVAGTYARLFLLKKPTS